MRYKTGGFGCIWPRYNKIQLYLAFLPNPGAPKVFLRTHWQSEMQLENKKLHGLRPWIFRISPYLNKKFQTLTTFWGFLNIRFDCMDIDCYCPHTTLYPGQCYLLNLDWNCPHLDLIHQSM